jgi:hypothetical protein
MSQMNHIHYEFWDWSFMKRNPSARADFLTSLQPESYLETELRSELYVLLARQVL